MAKTPLPEAFLCPITAETMSDPVMCSDGHSYERSAIAKWLGKSRKSPMTGATLATLALVPNHALRGAIEEFAPVSKEQRRLATYRQRKQLRAVLQGALNTAARYVIEAWRLKMIEEERQQVEQIRALERLQLLVTWEDSEDEGGEADGEAAFRLLLEEQAEDLLCPDPADGPVLLLDDLEDEDIPDRSPSCPSPKHTALDLQVRWRGMSYHPGDFVPRDRIMHLVGNRFRLEEVAVPPTEGYGNDLQELFADDELRKDLEELFSADKYPYAPSQQLAPDLTTPEIYDTFQFWRFCARFAV